MSLYSPVDSQHLTITAPAAAEVPSGPYTVAVLYRNIPFQSCILWRAYQPDNFTQLNMYFDGDVWISFSQWDGNLDTASAVWRWYVVTKSSAEEPPRVHVAEYLSTGALVWTHADTSSDYSAFGDLNRFCLGDEFGDGFRGEITCMTAFTSELSDSDVESIFSRSSAAIMNAGPQFFVHWPESDGASGPFVDLAGGGVETVREGTWQVSDDPTNFDFSLTVGRSGEPKAWSGVGWEQHPVKVWNGASWLAFPMSGYDGTDFIESK